jgi:hypothetical protein
VTWIGVALTDGAAFACRNPGNILKKFWRNSGNILEKLWNFSGDFLRHFSHAPPGPFDLRFTILDWGVVSPQAHPATSETFQRSSGSLP